MDAAYWSGASVSRDSSYIFSVYIFVSDTVVLAVGKSSRLRKWYSVKVIFGLSEKLRTLTVNYGEMETANARYL